MNDALKTHRKKLDEIQLGYDVKKGLDEVKSAKNNDATIPTLTNKVIFVGSKHTTPKGG